MSKSAILLICLISVMTSVLDADFSRKTHKFTNDIYNILRKKDGNIFFSPISIHCVLSMVYQGAAGDTAKSLQDTLSLPEANITSRKYKGVLVSLHATKDVQLHMANNIYIQKGYTLKPSFQSQVNNFFLADVQSIDFSERTHAVHQINMWVETKTNNKIKDIISENDISEDTRLILVNAIYFKGLWLHAFSKEDTILEKFYISSTAAVKCQMMHITKKYLYAENHELDAKVLNIPYVNERTNLLIILPNSRTGIKYLEKKLADIDLYDLIGTMRETEVVVSLPKFKIETSMDLNEPLSEMGLANIFGHNAEFSNMIDSSEPLSVSKVVQKAFIEVNEQGSEAASATGTLLLLRSMSPEKRQVLMTVNHPFIIIVTYRRIGKLYPIFMGKIMRPN